MRVAIFTETFLPQINGVVRTLEKVIKHLELRGHEVLLFAIGEGEDHYSKTPIVRVEGIPFSLYEELSIVKPQDKWLRKLIENEITQLPMTFLQTLVPNKHSVVEEALEKFKPDIIHLATPVTLGAIGIYYVDLLNLPCIATFHTDLAAYASKYQLPYFEEVANTITKTVYSKANRILAPSPSSQQQLQELDLENVGVFGRGVDNVLFDSSKRKREILKDWNLDPEKTTIAYVGRLAEEKSLPELINAFKDLSEKHEVQLLIVGDGPSRESLEKLLEDCDGDFAFTGIKKGEELAELYASADIFAFPSKTETFGQVVQEAMASALPVVGYDSPGVRDLVIEQETGFLAKDEVEFKDSIEKLVIDQELRSQFGTKAQQLSQDRTWDKILDGLIEEYKALIKVGAIQN